MANDDQILMELEELLRMDFDDDDTLTTDFENKLDAYMKLNGEIEAVQFMDSSDTVKKLRTEIARLQRRYLLLRCAVRNSLLNIDRSKSIEQIYAH